jgi:hypothetical protein
MKLRDLFRLPQVGDARIHVWEHSKDRRTDEQKRRNQELNLQRTEILWRSVFGEVPKMDAHVTAYQLHLAKHYVNANVLQFPKRARA